MADIRTYDNVPISYDVLQEGMEQYNSPKDKISELAQKGSLIRLKRGLYTIPRAISGQNLSTELIANHLYGPSYVSFENALSIHGLIPERVYTFKSATLKRRKEYNTPLGIFKYIHIPEDYYPIGLNLEIVNNLFAYMIAGPEKALCDQIISTKGLRLQSRKSVTEVYTIFFKTERSVKIKIEVDKDPPLNFNTEYKLLLLPFSFMTRCFTLPGLFAGKMHAMLFRTRSNRVKGRDWYDFEWHVRNGSKLDFVHLKERAIQSGNAKHEEFTKERFIAELKTKIQQTDLEKVKADVQPFLKEQESLEIWSNDYFIQLVDMIKFK